MGKLGDALVDYLWEHMRDLCNATLHDIGRNRYKWTDKSAITDAYNATKMRASLNYQGNSTIPICAMFSQGKCEKSGYHGELKHICVACWLNGGAHYPHSFVTCRRRPGQNSNQGKGQPRENQGQGLNQYNNNRQTYSHNHRRDRNRHNDNGRYVQAENQQHSISTN